MNITSRCGQQHERLDLRRARARPTTPRRARARACRPGSRRRRPRRRRRAPSGPAHDASHARAPAGEPAARRRRARRTARRPTRDASPSTRRSAQRAGCSSSVSAPSSPTLWPTSRAARPSWLGEPRSRSAAIAASAAARGARPAARTCSSLQRDVDLVGRPGAAGEEAGRRRLASTVRRRAVRGPRYGRAMARTRSSWGWGFEDAALIGASEAREAAPGHRRAARLRLGRARGAGAARAGALPRAAGRAARRRARGDLLAATTATAPTHAYGKSYLDMVRAFRGVLRARRPTSSPARATRREVEALLEWAAGANVAVIPYGGGTSVVGGVEPRIPARFDGALSLDLGALDRVLEVDPVSRAARIGAGASGPAPRGAARRARADAALLPAVVRALDARRLDRHARRRALRDRAHAHRRPRRVRPRDHAGGRLGVAAAAGLGRRARRPTGCCSARRATLGVITEAWVRVQPRPEHRAVGARCASTSFLRGAEAVRALAQSGLRPANCRLIDALRGAADRRGRRDARAARARLRVHRPRRRRATSRGRCELCREHGGGWDEPRPAAATARSAPGARRSCACPTCATCWCALGILSDTFETAITWERFPAFHETVLGRGRARRCGERVPRDLPLHPRLPRRPGAVLSPCSRRRAAATSSSSGAR